MSRRVSFYSGSTDTAMDRTLQIALRFYATSFEILVWERSVFQRWRTNGGVRGLTFRYPMDGEGSSCLLKGGKALP